MSHMAGYNRRDFLRFGTVAIGAVPFPTGAASADSPSHRGRAKACILLYMDGGPSHIDLWDMKPDAPAEIRGEFRPIATTVPGTQVCELLPRVARQMHHVAQVRSVCHTETVHDPAVYQMLTGRKHFSSAGNLTVQPNDFPQLGTLFGALDEAAAVMPKVVELPETMKMEGRVLPGQNAGFLGATYDPFRLEMNAETQILPPEFTPHADISRERLARRASLLDQVHDRHHGLHRQSEARDLDGFQQQALALLSRPEVRRAFDLSLEPNSVRDTYGGHRHGQSVLLARRLVEAGARFVTVYWGRENQDWADGRGPRPANNPWDTHRNHFPLLKHDLVPRADQTLAALLDDLHQRGLLTDTLVVWMGDFGRSPRIDRQFASRDHWPRANTVLFAGAGVPAGAIYGSTDRHAAEVNDAPVSPADLTATILHLLGIRRRATIRDRQGRPYVASEGEPIAAVIR